MPLESSIDIHVLKDGASTHSACGQRREILCSSERAQHGGDGEDREAHVEVCDEGLMRRQ